MTRQNTKTIKVNLDTCISKSNELSLAKMQQGLSLRQTQLLAYAIYSTQKKGSTSFQKVDFEKQFNLSRYHTVDAIKDTDKLMLMRLTFKDMERDEFAHSTLFKNIYYNRGTFLFEWNETLLPHILDLQTLYLLNDLTLTSQFKSAFSWVLYEHLKASYGYWHKQFTKEELMEVFAVSDVKSYQNNTSVFMRKVLDVAVSEINTYTELEVRYDIIKQGRAVVGFDIHWSTGNVVKTASPQFLSEIQALYDAIRLDMSTFITLDDDAAKAEAFEVFKHIQARASELSPDIQQEQAQSIYDFMKLRMTELNRILVRTQTVIPRNTIFYDWLNERE